MRLCWDCHQPTGRGPRARLCVLCVRSRNRVAVRRYMGSGRGRAVRRKYARSPKGKVTNAAWKESHPENVSRSEGRRVDHRPNKIGQRIVCVTTLCTGSWVRTRQNGARKLCLKCRWANYGWYAYRDADRKVA
jgi:hypothetical protein